MTEKTLYELRIEPEQFRKMEIVAEKEGLSVNNYILKLIRTNIAYYERIHGKIRPEKAVRKEESES